MPINRILLLIGALVVSRLLSAQAVEPMKTAKWGPNDTIIVAAIIYNGESMPYRELEMVYVSNMPAHKLAKAIQKYNRLRNAVYVTYPYARTAGNTLNDVRSHLTNLNSRGDWKDYIKSREKELKTQFADPLSNLSVYQGKVLMKLINRQTGNNCYEIIKEYKGGLNARMYQTVAFFFGSSLKQDYDWQHDATDRQIEAIVKEIDGSWYNNPYKPGVRTQ
ncbi:DUF4294 domain-containing protein [Paraflavisolibacter sp. H34]|uniref:DUF4294 domain-containing protein n=1 Tax=Huijunlia imazamoxiresistens TaxID=3127457 RepID=UPI003018F53F